MAEGSTDQRNRNGLATQASAYLQLLGYLEPGHEARAGERKITEALKSYRQQNQIPDATRTADVLQQMKREIASDPEATRRMQALASGRNGQAPSAHDISVVQIGLQARNSPVAVTGTMNEPTRNSLASAVSQADSSAKIPAGASARAAFTSAAKYDPKIAEAQAYMRILGFNGAEGKQNTGPIDGIKGPLTTAALEQFSKENKLPKDASMNDIIAALKGKALAGPGLARMEDMMGKSVTAGRVSQDIKAIQVALKANGMNVPATGQPDSNTLAAINVMKSRLPAGAAADTAASREADLAAMQAQMRMAREAAGDVSAAADNTESQQPKPKIEERVTTPSSLPKQEIHVAPGGETKGIAPRTDGGVVTVVVDDPKEESAKPVIASANASSADVEKANMRVQLEAQQARIKALEQEQSAMKATGVRPPEAERPVVGRGPHLSSANGAYTANASQRWSTPPGGAYSQAASVAREIERGNPEAAGIRVDSFRVGNREVVYAQTPDGMAYKFNSTRDGTLMTAGAYNMNNPRESQMFTRELSAAVQREPAMDQRMENMRRNEERRQQAEMQNAGRQFERGSAAMGDRNPNNNISGAIDMAQGALKIFRPGGGMGF